MKKQYERIKLEITRFDDEDVITTSDINNAYRSLSDLNADEDVRTPVPNSR